VCCWQLYLTSLGEKTQRRLDDVGDYAGWDVSESDSIDCHYMQLLGNVDMPSCGLAMFTFVMC